MRVLLAVIDDLFMFVRTALFGVLAERQSSTNTDVFLLQNLAPQLQIPSLSDSSLHLATREVSSVPFSFSSGSTYFVGEASAWLYCDPVVAFDTAVMRVPYGTFVQVVKLGGRWAEVMIDRTQGWMMKDLLREQAHDVFPVFTEGVLYDAHNPNTKKLRLYIEDSFGGFDASISLGDAEFVSYKLQKRDIHIPWALERPRLSGTWQRKLRGKIGVHMSIAPSAGAVMEYVTDNEGHLCYVEAVFPDESIKVTSVGVIEEGMYFESLMTKDQWKELRPVFIEIT